MRHINPGIAIIFTILLCACDKSPPAPQGTAAPAASRHADLVLTNARAYTLLPDRPWVQAIAISDGIIEYAGGDEGTRAWVGPNTRVVDLGGRLLLPAFQDAHVHPLSSGMDFQQCPLYGLTKPAEYTEAVTRCAQARPTDAWIVGSGWLVTAFAPSGTPDRKLLDAVVADRPVALTSTDGHSLWVNSKALEIAGITAETKDPANGRIDRDAAGQPLGSLQESAMDLVYLHVPPPSSQQLVDALKYSVKLMNGLGITAWQDASVSVRADDPFQGLNTYKQVNASGDLTAHVVESLLWDNERGLEQVDEILEAARVHAGDGPNVRSVKIFMDGVIETQTAALIDEYTDKPAFSSHVQVAPEVLSEAVARLDKAGMQVHIHAIGDRAVRISLDAFEHALAANGASDRRHHIAHIQMIHPQDQPRFAKLGVVANFQPLWAYADAYITEMTIPRIGPERLRYVYPIASMWKSGARVAFGSDWSVSSVNPLEGIETAVTRMGAQGETSEPFLPEERITVEQAVASYTINAAFVNHLDDRTGTLEAGKLADLIVLDRNIFEIPPEQLSEAKVLLTLYGGKAVHGSWDEVAAP